MDFTKTLAGVTWLLLTEGRVSYRRIKREFDLDDGTLEDLRYELIQVKGFAADHEGAFLVWAGGGPAAPVAGANELRPLAARPDPAAEMPAGEAERRPLTVMFCDLADSTALSTQLDPEDLRDVIRAYQERCTAIIRDYEGFVAKFMGDGILVYFGYPTSLERNAERAVRTGLAIVEAMTSLNAELARAKGIEIAVRIGIATGLVMVGEIVGEGLAQERAVIGEAPNVAARLQGLAERNGIVVGSLTKEVAGDAFAYQELGTRELKGISGHVKVWGVTGLRHENTEEEDRAETNGSVPPELVGRDEETGLLRRAWQGTRDEGRGQVVLISGEAGIGKSALVDGLRAEVRAEGLPRMTVRCSPYHINSALHPLIEHFKRLAGWQQDDTPGTRLAKLEAMLELYGQPLAETVPLLASLLLLPLPEDRYPPLELAPQQQKQQTQDAIIAMTLEAAERQPLLELWEDLHWADPSTLELLGLLIDQAPTASLLIVLTARPEFVPPWPARSHMTPITLNRLERAHSEALVSRLAGDKPLPAEVVEHVVSKTDGVPLYVEELTKTILASDILREADERFELTGPLASLSIPETLHESLMARLDRLPQVREIAQLGSVLGREFAHEMISGLSDASETTLQEGLGQLVDSELLYQRGRPPRARYTFKHALVQDAAYQSILKRTRVRYHRQVAELVRSRFPEIGETQPEILARHYAEAGLDKQAIECWHQAARQAVSRAANIEAIVHLRGALELLQGLPESTERTRQELLLRISLAATLSVNKGYASAEAGEAYARALTLSHQVGEVLQHLTVLRGLWIFHFVRGDLQAARKLGQECFALTERDDDRAVSLEGHHMLGDVLFCQGEFPEAQQHLDDAIAFYDPSRHRTDFLYGSLVGILPLCFAAHNLWHLGYPDRAVQSMQRALALAHELAHPFGLALAFDYAAMLRQFRRETKMAQEQAEAAIELCSEKGFAYYLAWGKIIEGWTLVAQGGGAGKIDQMREGLASLRATGAALRLPYYLVTLAEASGKASRIDEGLAYLAEAEEAALTHGERWREAERHRLRGELLLLQAPESFAEAESSFLQAIQLARQQQAKSLELRAALSLGRLFQRHGKQSDARELLAPVYDWFTEGFETDDLKDAKALIDHLGDQSA